ncbi:MAG: hypothetical protein J6S85_12780 [Methanobrevibacter sp.]|nr:hypothetical protein [Methanobrevibacter sp.]
MENNSFLEGNGIIILILFFIMMMGGGFGWGGNANNAAVQGALTRADVNDAITFQNIGNGIGNLSNNINMGFAGIQNSLGSLSGQMATTCCDMKATVLADGQLTRQMIQDQTIQDLRDKLADKDKEILVAQLAASQVAQTTQLENYIDSKLATTTTTA